MDLLFADFFIILMLPLSLWIIFSIFKEGKSYNFESNKIYNIFLLFMGIWIVVSPITGRNEWTLARIGLLLNIFLIIIGIRIIIYSLKRLDIIK